MDHLPVFLDIKGRSALVVGGGDAAGRKARLLAKAGAEVTVVAASPCADLLSMTRAGEVTLEVRDFDDGDVIGRAIVISAIGTRREDAAVSRAAQAAGVLVNVVDTPALCSFIMPAIVERDAITVAISSGGTAPILARSVRLRIERMLPPGIGRLARFAESFRGAVKATHPEPLARRRFWERFFDGAMAEMVLKGDDRGARERMLTEVNRAPAAAREDGIVYLVHAGSGDPELLTLRTLRLLEGADVIVHDPSIGSGVLDHARRDAERIDAGQGIAADGAAGGRIDELLAGLARAGNRVVRLRAGDPPAFGRGDGEFEYLQRHGIRAEMVRHTVAPAAAEGRRAAIG